MARGYRKYKSNTQVPDISEYKHLTSDQLALEAAKYSATVKKAKGRKERLNEAQNALQSVSNNLRQEINREINKDGRSKHHKSASTIVNVIGLVSGVVGTYFTIVQFPRFFELLSFFALILSYMFCAGLGTILAKMIFPIPPSYEEHKEAIEKESSVVQALKMEEVKLNEKIKLLHFLVSLNEKSDSV